MSLFGDITADTDISQLPGTTGGASASAGNIGEVAQVLVGSASAVSLSTGTPANVASLSLTSGDWDVQGLVTFKYTSATVNGDAQVGISGASATLPGDSLRGYDGSRTTTTTFNVSVSIPVNQFNSNLTQAVYLVAQAAFSAGTCVAFGNIIARRVR